MPTEDEQNLAIVSTKPRGAIRWKYWAPGGLLAFVAFAAILPNREPPSYFYLGLFSAVSLVVAFSMCREMLMVKAKHMARRTGFALGIGSALAVLVFLVLRDLEVFVWNSLYLKAFFIVFFALTGICAWIAERRNSVHIYADLEGVKFVLTPKPSNEGVEPTR